MAAHLWPPDSGRYVQVPPELLAVRPRRVREARASQGRREDLLAVAALQPVEPRRRGLRVILAGILTPLEDLLTWALTHLHDTVGLTWAWSIVALVVIVRMKLVPLTVRQIHSMQNLQAHAPEMKALQSKYKHDRQKMNQELMAFYKENQINPAAS